MTITARGKEINMASLIASNDTAIAVSNVKMNARGDILGPGGEIKVPAQDVQKEYYEEKLTAPAETVKTLDDLQEKVTGKNQKINPIYNNKTNDNIFKASIHLIWCILY